VTQLKPAYFTSFGACYQGDSESVLESEALAHVMGKVNLILTSPPFPLLRKKKYGNLQGEAYIEWIARFGDKFHQLLSDNGSLVIEIGNAWEPGRPVMSTLPLRSLLALQEAGEFSLCQQFIWNNPARLPSPAQWVNVERIRVKDSFTHIWWLSKTERPQADNRQVLREYSDSMKGLLANKRYNPGKRPSEHHIGQHSFLTDNAGAIPSNVFQFSNTHANNPYIKYCKENELKLHPARMPLRLVEFFVRFLTKPHDLVLDPFAGSNTTGAGSEILERRWVAIEREAEYVAGSKGWFCDVGGVKKP
jgi:site-specific DNA-methyltransferase (cytosine-N4-specific)